ncbi:hypothetical protein NT6N_22630 [Oceaniferula spumae]|uniref:DUF4034 domain-containing protein n=1 Tax=Oceaniferula spumae TaxID=2979115 RepID=A0AAT9FMM9_9BACT
MMNKWIVFALASVAVIFLWIRFGSPAHDSDGRHVLEGNGNGARSASTERSTRSRTSSRKETREAQLKREFLAILDNDDMATRKAAFAEFLASLTSDADHQAAMEVLAKEFYPRETGSMLRQIMQQWAAMNPLGALAFSDLDHKDPRFKGTCLINVFAVWIKHDPAAARAKAAEPKYKDSNAAIGMTLGLMDVDLIQARDGISSLEREFDRSSALNELFSRYAAKDEWAEAAKWVNGLPEGEFAEMAAEEYIERMQSDAPEEARMWARSMENGDPKKDPLMYSIALRYQGSNHSVEGAKWFLEIPPAKDTDRARAFLARALSETNPELARKLRETMTTPE